MDAGVISHSLTQVRRTVLLAVKTAIVYLQRRAISCCMGPKKPMNAADFILKSAHFVFQDIVRRFRKRSAFFTPFAVIWPASWEHAGRRIALYGAVCFPVAFSFSLPDRAARRGLGGKETQKARYPAKAVNIFPAPVKRARHDKPTYGEARRKRGKIGDAAQTECSQSPGCERIGILILLFLKNTKNKKGRRK